jgi:hypothetical protein
MRTALLLAIVLCMACTSGCFLLDERPAKEVLPPVTTIALPTTAGFSLPDPSGMALQLADLPAGYIIRERSDIAYADIAPLARDLGWKRGYLSSFYRLNADKYDATAISQKISVYYVSNEHLLDKTMGPVFDMAKTGLTGSANGSVTVTELPFPSAGDRTAAFRTVDASDPYGIVVYTVIFTRGNIIEQVEMRGTTTDSEVLKSVVAKAAEKIR